MIAVRRVLSILIPAAVLFVAAPAHAANTTHFWMAKDKASGHALMTDAGPPTSHAVLSALGVTSPSAVDTCGGGTSFKDVLFKCLNDLNVSVDTVPIDWKANQGAHIMRLNFDQLTPGAPVVSANGYQQTLNSVASANPLDALGRWAVGGAQQILGAVEGASTSVTTPELSSAWFAGLFAYVVAYAAGLALLFALVGLIVAAARRDAEVVVGVVYGIVRAGLVTAMVVPLTIVVLAAVDGICTEIVKAMPSSAFSTLSDAWGSSGAGAFASGILAFLGALIEIVVAFVLLVELLLREAAIYVAVLFFPVTLAMAVFPSLRGAQQRITQVLGAFIAFKPVALLTLLAGVNILAGGVSLVGQAASVGTIIAGIAVIGLAALSPWTLMFLLGVSGAMHGGSFGSPVGGAGRASGGQINHGSVEEAGGDLAASPLRSSAPGAGSSGGQARPRAAGGAIAAAAGWLGGVADAGQLAVAHVAERVHAAAGSPGGVPARPAWTRTATATAGNGSPASSVADETRDAAPAATAATSTAPEVSAPVADSFGVEKEALQ